MTYTIKVQTIDKKLLTYSNVIDYTIKDSMVHFTDSRTKLNKHFPSRDSNIEEEKE